MSRIMRSFYDHKDEVFSISKIKDVLETYKKGITLGVIILFIFGIIIFLTSEIAMNLFSDNENVKKYGSDYLKISALMFPAFPFFFIGNATFQGLKKAIIVNGEKNNFKITVQQDLEKFKALNKGKILYGIVV